VSKKERGKKDRRCAGPSPSGKNEEKKPRQVVGFLGVGLDNADGHQRLSQSEHFLLIGGSKETHERMQDTAIKFDEGLRRHGKALEETPLEEVIDIFHEAQD
jgi:hypothetical protein